jgi:CheY-like chemotaxis protein
MDAKPETHNPIGLLLCDDLLFSSRITATARSLGLSVLPAGSVAALYDLLSKQTPSCIIVDLAVAGRDLSELLGQLRTSASPLPRVVAYGSHVDTATLKAAREAGCDPVLPRSKFVEELPQALPRWLASPSTPTPPQTD